MTRTQAIAAIDAFLRRADGSKAQIIRHELDHCNGILI